MRQKKVASSLPWLQGKCAPAMWGWTGCTETLVKWDEGLRIYNFKCHFSIRALGWFQGCSERQSSVLAASWTLLGKGTGLRLSAKSVVTFASMFVVCGKATVQSMFFFLPFTVSSGVVAMLTALYLDFCYQNLLVPELQNSFPNCIVLPVLHFHFPQAGSGPCCLLPASWEL